MALNRVPREVKEAIWKSALPDDEPEVCIMWPLRFQGLSQTTQTLPVDTAFPVLMHVCREWRAFVLSPLSGVAFRRSRLAGCGVPYRPYRPDLDAFFVNSYNAMFTLQAMAKDDRRGDAAAAVPNPGFWRTLCHLAVEPPVFGEAHEWLPELVFRYSPDLQKVSTVFPSSRKPLWELFHRPRDDASSSASTRRKMGRKKAKLYPFKSMPEPASYGWTLCSPVSGEKSSELVRNTPTRVSRKPLRGQLGMKRKKGYVWCTSQRLSSSLSVRGMGCRFGRRFARIEFGLFSRLAAGSSLPLVTHIAIQRYGESMTMLSSRVGKRNRSHDTHLLLTRTNSSNQ